MLWQTKSVECGFNFYVTGLFMYIRRGLLSVVFAINLLIPHMVEARILFVGPQWSYKVPSQAIKAAKDGDTIRIEPGLYESDYATITRNNLTIEGNGGVAHMRAVQHIPNKKAIWIIRGDNTTIRNIEFSNAHVRDKNGAGIRHENGSLFIEDCYFHHNEMGILTSNKGGLSLTIRRSEFSLNTQDYPKTRKLSHNIYVGQIDMFTMENSKAHSAHFGHNVKSRAKKNIIKNNFIYDSLENVSSYLIDIPNGGEALIEANFLLQSANAENTAMISYGAEGMKHEKNSLKIYNNEVVNEHRNGILLRNHSSYTADFENNKFSGNPDKEYVERGDGILFTLKKAVKKFLGR